MTRDEFSAIEPAAHGAVVLGDGAASISVVVKPLTVGQLPAFARAVRPLVGELEKVFAAGISTDTVLGLVEDHFDIVIDALQAATGATRDAISTATVDQALELVLAVLSANKDFLRGRMASALKTAAALSNGAGPTPSQP